MSIYSHKGKKIHYEVYGEGEPLILLNGVMMSTISWQAFVETFQKNHQLILMDFFDQGQSEFLNELYDQSIQVDAVKGLMDHLGLESVHLAGVSYGGEVAMQLTAEAPERVRSLYLANTTAWTFPALVTVGKAWISAAKSRDASTFFNVSMPSIYSIDFFEKNQQWLKTREEAFGKLLTADWYDGFIRLVLSAESHDVRDKLSLIKCPVMVVGSENDALMPPEYQKFIADGVHNASFVTLPGCGHASMYEAPEAFAATLLGFLAGGLSEIRVL